MPTSCLLLWRPISKCILTHTMLYDIVVYYRVVTCTQVSSIIHALSSKYLLRHTSRARKTALPPPHARNWSDPSLLRFGFLLFFIFFFRFSFFVLFYTLTYSCGLITDDLYTRRRQGIARPRQRHDLANTRESQKR